LGTWTYIRGVLIATWTGLRHLFHPRMTLRYPEQKLDLEGPGYGYDAKQGVGLPGFKGRHILYFEKCTGCQLCAIACDGVAVAIEMQKVPKGKPHNRKDIWPAVDYGRCVPPSTPITTIDGIKPMSEIRVGDRVLTHTGKFRKVTRLFSRSYTGKLYTFRTLGNFDLLTTTEDHPILVYGEKGVSWMFARDIKYRTYLTRPVIVEELPREHIEYTYELYHPSGRGGSFTTEVVSLPATQELMRLVGYYLAEGASDRYRVSFDLHKDEEDLQSDIASCIARVFGSGVSVKPDPDSQGLKICVDSVRVAAFFSQFGHSSDTKRLPWWMVLLPPESIREIVRGEFWGDGHYSNKFYFYRTKMHSNYFTTRTTSKELAMQMHYMLGRLGILSSISTQRQKDRKLCYSVTVHTPYVESMGALVEVPAKNNEVSHGYVHLSDGMVVSPVVKIEKQEVKDYPVLNIEVEDDNSYVAANIAIHNCVFCGLCVVPETEVMTNPGLKLISEISAGDRVLTHTGEYKPVTKVWEFIYSGTLYEIKALGKPEPLICTVDHKILAVRRPLSNRRDGRLLRRIEPLEMVLPRNLKTGDYIVTPIPKRVINLEEVVVEFVGHYGTKTLVLEAEPSLFRLIGYYLAEGSTHLNGRSVTLSFGSIEQDLIDDSTQLFTKYFSKEPAVQILRQHVANVRLGSSLALKFFSQFGRGASSKSLPDWVFFANKEKQVQLIKGLFLGDGCVVNQSRQKYLNITTVSKVLASQVQLVLARLGIVSTIAKETVEGKLPAYRVNVFGRWAIKLAEMMAFRFDYSPAKSSDKFLISSDYVFSPIERIAVQNVSDRTVMDVTVEGDHTFVGSGIVQHNCVDACPFDALFMTNDYELSAYDRTGLKYTPDMLAVPPKLEGKKYKVKLDTETGEVRYG